MIEEIDDRELRQWVHHLDAAADVVENAVRAAGRSWASSLRDALWDITPYEEDREEPASPDRNPTHLADSYTLEETGYSYGVSTSEEMKYNSQDKGQPPSKINPIIPHNHRRRGIAFLWWPQMGVGNVRYNAVTGHPGIPALNLTERAMTNSEPQRQVVLEELAQTVSDAVADYYGTSDVEYREWEEWNPEAGKTRKNLLSRARRAEKRGHQEKAAYFRDVASPIPTKSGRKKY